MQTQVPFVNQSLNSPGEQRLTLHNVSWDSYDKLLEAFGEHRAVRFHYDQGVLELMVPLEAHENPSDLIGVFIRTLAFECGLNIKGLASTTLRRKEFLKGAEPDKCYYLQNEPLVRGRIVNLDQDPPPDLVVEVDISHSDIDKELLYAQIGIPELWRFNGKNLRIFQLQQDRYQEVTISASFPWVAMEVFDRFLYQCKEVGETKAYQELRVWIQAHKPQV